MFLRSAGVKRARTVLLRSMKVCSRLAPVHGLRGSFFDASRPSVKSMLTRLAPASKQPRMSFSHSLTRSLTKSALG